jgi:hypothetical protein
MATNQTTGLLKYLGMIGNSGLHTGSLVPRANTPDAQQRLFQDFQDAGKVADPDIWTKFNTYMRRPTTFDSMLQMWEEMSMWDLIAAALVEIVDEATQVDANSPASVWFQCNDQDFEEELNDMLLRVGVEDIIQSQVYYVASLGNHFEKIEYTPGEGVMGLSFVHPLDMRRYWLERNRKCIGFRWTGHKPNKEDVFVHPDNRTPVERVTMTNGKDLEELWYPWDFLHMRRMFRNRITEHGEPIFAEADGIYKKLRIAIDQMVVHRAQVQPDRYAINIDVQEQPPIEQMKTVQRWRQQLRSKLAFGAPGDPTGVGAPTDFTSYYNALALDTIIYLAQPKGFNNTITKLQGTAQVPDVYDIELLTDLFYSIIGMPRSWFGAKSGDSGSDQAPSGKSLLAQDMRFLRKIKSIRRPIIQSYEWLGYFHAVLKGKNTEQLDIKVKMPEIGSLEDQMKMEMLRMQAEVMDILADVMDKYALPKEAWVETIFKRYMHLPDDVVNVFITALPAQMDDQQQQESLKKPAPRAYKLIREVEEALDKSPGSRRLIAQLKDAHRITEEIRGKRHKMSMENLIGRPNYKENDLIISSFGKHPFELKRPTQEQQALHESAKGKSTMRFTMNERTAQPSRARFADDPVPYDAPSHPSQPTPITEASSNPEPAYRRWIS